MENVKNLADLLVKLSVEELLYMKTYLKDTYGLEETTTAVQVLSEPVQVEELEKYHALKIITHGAAKLSLVKEYNSIASIGLTMAKAAIENTEVPIFKNKDKDYLVSIIDDWVSKSQGFSAEIVSSETPWKD